MPVDPPLQSRAVSPVSPAALRDAFRGVLLGTFAGDALGAPFEGLSPARLRREHGEVRDMTPGRLARGSYTDDTQMMVAVAEWLVAGEDDDPGSLARRLVAAYDPARGYGRGTTNVLRRLRDGAPWETAADSVYPRGSFGNGAALRVGPCAVLFHHDAERLDRLVAASALVTHSHPLGVAGAVLQARQIAHALARRAEPLDPIGFVVELRSSEVAPEYRQKLRTVEECLERPPDPDRVRDRLGANATALGSVATALYCFLAHAPSFEDAVIFAVNLGGDTDSVAAMTGAIAGAFHGARALPTRWRAALEEGERGAAYVESLADRLLERHLAMRAPRRTT